MTRSNNGQDKE